MDFVFNCTAAFPFTKDNVLKYVLALGFDPEAGRGKVTPVSVRHDEDDRGICMWCGAATDESELFSVERKKENQNANQTND